MAARASNSTERTRRAATGQGRSTGSARGTGAETGSRSKRSTGTTRRAATGGHARSPRQSSSERVRELTALVLFGVAIFLLFALIATEKGGVVGGAVNAALGFAFGRLAFLVPLTLIAVGVTTVFELRVWRSLHFAGVAVFLFGLFVLVSAGAPPFGGHGEEMFVRAEFEGRAGGLGEAFYAGLHALVGVVGVGIIGWLAGLAGVSLVTGITARWVGRRTRRAAQVVKNSAERSTLVTRRRNGDAESTLIAPGLATARTAVLGGSAGDAVTTGTAPQFGPVDLTQAEARTQSAGIGNASHGTFGDAFDDWAEGRSSSRSPLAPIEYGRDGRGHGLVDGAEAFADIYGPGGEGAVATMPSKAGTNAENAASFSAPKEKSGEGGVTGPGVGDEAAATIEVLQGDGEAVLRQEALPGLARQPRQIELPVADPGYLLPESDMLHKSAPVNTGRGSGERDIAAVLLQALSQFGVEARIIGMVVGPRVTRYELQLAPGTKVAKVSSLKDDLAYALATTEIRILAPIPGKSAVGVEIPNQRPDWVTLGDIYHEFPKSAGPLMVWLGKDISGKAVYADLTKLPHLLIAGTTGSGKSGCVNCIVSSVLLRSTPEQVRMIMIDPKKVELSHYDRIPHLLVPVVTNMKDAAGVLHNVVKEMEDRYELMELDHARTLSEMNKTRARRGERPMPCILIVIDELADLMMASPQEVEDHVIRLAQKSRAVGIHLVVATQRPSADVITGMIKANIPSRIAFAVSSQTDSRVILDVNGAETLLGMGDMLFKPLGSSHMQRVQGAYITEEEIALLVNHWRHQAEPEFREELLKRPAEVKKADDESFDPDSDELLVDAAQLVIETGSASVSMLQRRLRVGYTRAGRLIDMLERRGIVGPWEGSKPRQILIEPDEFEHVLASLRADDYPADGENGDD